MSENGWPFLDWPYPIPFAHRGGASDKPENTLAAFERAVELGYRYVETDAHLTADGVLLAFHDHVLDRVTDRTGVVADLPWAEIQQARVDGEPIPLLEDLLGAWRDVRVNIDPKHDAAVGPLVDLLGRCNAFDRVCVAAFSDRRLTRVRRMSGGRVCTALGPTGITRMRRSDIHKAIIRLTRMMKRRPNRLFLRPKSRSGDSSISSKGNSSQRRRS